MQYVQLTFKELNLDETVKTGKAVYAEKSATHIVASTKSYNNLIEDYQAKNQAPTSTTKEDLWLDRAVTETALKKLVAEQVKDTEKAKLVTEYLEKAFNGLCVYYTPIVRSKKA